MKHCLLAILMMTTLALAAPNDPKGVAAGFYEWYMTHENKIPAALAERKADFTPQLYNKLNAAYKANHIDFDPFVNAQIFAQHYLIGRVELHGQKAEVHVSLELERGASSNITLLMTETPQQQWQIADIRYPAEGDVKSWTLMPLLEEK